VARTLSLQNGAVRLRDAQRGEELQFDGMSLTTLFGPRWRLLLIGAGQLSQAVAQMAQTLDFEVLVCDPREEYAGALQITGVTRVMGMPDDVVTHIMTPSWTTWPCLKRSSPRRFTSAHWDHAETKLPANCVWLNTLI
jgi:xanthine dehydrogenase accessory factor